MASERRILHIDMDAFFASVEQVRDPSLKGKPLIIGGDKTARRGVVSTASYEARQYGVHSAMPLAQARRLCPHGIFMRGNFELYREAAQRVRAMLEKVSPKVEFASIDEAYIDVSGSRKLFGGEDAISKYIKSSIRETTQLPCTIAIASNKLVAKVASDEGKPDGYIRIETGDEAAFLRPLPIRKLPGVGPRTCDMLESLGVMTIGCLAELPQQALLRVFGPAGYGLQRRARGICATEVEVGGRPRSIGRETTFERDRSDWRGIERVLTYLAERVAYRLRAKGMETRCVTLKVRYAGFDTHTFASTLPESTSADTDIIEALAGLLPKAKARREPVRLVGVSLTSLVYDQHQMYLFGRERAEKWGRAFQAVDRLRSRHGFEAVRLGKSMASPAGDPVKIESLWQ